MKKLLTISGLALLLASHNISAESGYVDLIPNGGVNSCSTCHTGIPSPRNDFGNAFAGNGHNWNATLAALDSDSDGFTNGQELADPDGAFTLIAGAQVTNPGVSSNFPVLGTPSISIDSPINAEVFNAPYVGPIAASTSDPVESITKIDFFSGASLLGTVTALPFTLAVNLSEGSYVLTATATDYLGATGDSAPVSITVNAAAVAPTITTQPASQTVTEGADVTFTVAATGTATLSYQWRKDTADIGGANSATLALNNVTASDAGNYAVVVSNTAGTVTSDTATLTVNPTDSTNLAPIVRLVKPEDGATFEESKTIVLQAEARDADGRITEVEFFAGTTSLGIGELMSSERDDDDDDDLDHDGDHDDLDHDDYDDLDDDHYGDRDDGDYDDLDDDDYNGDHDDDLGHDDYDDLDDDDDDVDHDADGEDRHEDIFLLNWLDVPAGEYVLTAKATDDQGATATSDPIHITVSNGTEIDEPLPPVVPVDLGWVYWLTTGEGDDVYLYDIESRWLWTSGKVLPYLWCFDRKQWTNLPVSLDVLAAKATKDQEAKAASDPENDAPLAVPTLYLGWVYWLTEGSGGIYVYDIESGWLWTSGDVLPYLWCFDQGQWYQASPP